MNTIGQPIIQLAMVILAAYLAAQFTLNKAKKEKAWTSKLEAYRSIVEHIHDMITLHKEESGDGLPIPESGMSEDERSKLASRRSEGLSIIEKHIRLAGLVISRKGAEKLDALLSEYYEELRQLNLYTKEDQHPQPSSFESALKMSSYHSNMANILETHVQAIVDLARKDLGL